MKNFLAKNKKFSNLPKIIQNPRNSQYSQTGSKRLQREEKENIENSH
jgi:hypothetical protein